MIRHRWDPPNEGDYKANCDSVIDCMDGRIGVGIAIRDSGGKVLASCSQVFEATFRIKIAKLMAILKCLQFGYDCGLSLKVIESDEATVVKWINDGDANKVAKGLAINALGIDEDTFWMEESPPCIRKEVEADKTG
ncbi:hypothetical protein Ddye_010072 [Dipteronia dyeriana]|uniref:RNase H type-1 domain-containing protein n=1 Tax=Dipteronia dyeriana TaxID=168575 RepID=A0AAD9XCV2_9ROSI|nr:hypothetical protein Ddye_010072 [Dipteronia dyeriana]